jgi:hypothetical protein
MPDSFGIVQGEVILEAARQQRTEHIPLQRPDFL